jgi:hypothetical protein
VHHGFCGLLVADRDRVFKDTEDPPGRFRFLAEAEGRLYYERCYEFVLLYFGSNDWNYFDGFISFLCFD